MLLGSLQTTKTCCPPAGQPRPPSVGVFPQLVSTVGNKARELGVNRDAQESLVQQASSAQQSLVGVNLDEEAANLIRYQQAYQAAKQGDERCLQALRPALALGQ